MGIREKLLAKRLAPKQSRMSIYGVVDAIYSNYVQSKNSTAITTSRYLNMRSYMRQIYPDHEIVHDTDITNSCKLTVVLQPNFKDHHEHLLKQSYWILKTCGISSGKKGSPQREDSVSSSDFFIKE